jgi:hypothetical protein
MKRTDRRVLGWLAVGLLSLVLSSSAWALDLDGSIQQQETDAAQIMSTLAHHHHTPPSKHSTRKIKHRKVYVMIFKAHAKPHKKA